MIKLKAMAYPKHRIDDLGLNLNDVEEAQCMVISYLVFNKPSLIVEEITTDKLFTYTLAKDAFNACLGLYYGGRKISLDNLERYCPDRGLVAFVKGLANLCVTESEFNNCYNHCLEELEKAERIKAVNKGNNNFYLSVQHADDLGSSPDAKKNLLNVINTNSRAKGYCELPISTIAGKLNKSPRTTKRYLAELIEEGFIKRGDSPLTEGLKVTKINHAVFLVRAKGYLERANKRAEKHRKPYVSWRVKQEVFKQENYENYKPRFKDAEPLEAPIFKQESAQITTEYKAFNSDDDAGSVHRTISKISKKDVSELKPEKPEIDQWEIDIAKYAELPY